MCHDHVSLGVRAGVPVKMPMYGSIAEALMQPKRYRWFTGVVLAPYLPWTFSTSWPKPSLPMTSQPSGVWHRTSCTQRLPVDNENAFCVRLTVCVEHALGHFAALQQWRRTAIATSTTRKIIEQGTIPSRIEFRPLQPSKLQQSPYERICCSGLSCRAQVSLSLYR